MRQSESTIPEMKKPTNKAFSKMGCILFEWGNTLMRDFPEYKGPMYQWPTVELIHNARRILSALHEKWVIAIATNAENSTRNEIKRAFSRVGLMKYVDEIFCYHTVGYLKPSSMFYESILANLGFDRSNVFMVGDNYFGDIVGANKAGIKGFWLNMDSDDTIKNPFCDTLRDLSELPAHLDYKPIIR